MTPTQAAAEPHVVRHRPHPWTIFDFLKLLAVGFLLLPVAQSMAQDDYVFIRWLATTVLAYGAYRHFKKRHHLWGALFIVPLVFFNPLFRLHLGREIWMIVDACTAALLAASLTQPL